MKKTRHVGLVSLLLTAVVSLSAPAQATVIAQAPVEDPAPPFDIPPTGIGAMTIVGPKKVGGVLTLKNDFIRQHPEFFVIEWFHGCGNNATEYRSARNKMRVRVQYRDHVEVIANIVKGFAKGGDFASPAVTIRGTTNCMNF